MSFPHINKIFPYITSMVYLSKLVSLMGAFTVAILMIFTQPASAEVQPEHVIFFVHGLQGDSKTFCDFTDVLKQDLEEALGGNKKVLTHGIDYATFKEAELFEATGAYKAVTVFAAQLNGFIANYYAEKGLNLNTPFSLVVHSQGGIVAAKYVEKCVWNTIKNGRNACKTHTARLIKNGAFARIAKDEFVVAATKSIENTAPLNLKHVISLGSPHHGSPGANFLLQGFTGILDDIISRLSGTPLQNTDLALGSSSIHRTRNFLTRRATRRRWRTPYYVNRRKKLDVKFHNVIGKLDHPHLSTIAKLATNENAETDIVVDSASANQDFNYYIMKNENSKPMVGQTDLVANTSVWLNEHAHTTEPPLVKFEEAIQCIEKDVPHTTLTFVRKVFLDHFGIGRRNSRFANKIPKSDSLRNFATDVHVYFPDKMRRGPDRPSLRVEYGGKGLRDGEIFRITNTFANKHWGYNRLETENANTAKEQRRLVYHHQGRLSARNSLKSTAGRVTSQGKKRMVRYKISHPGFVTKIVDLPVNPGMSTLAQIYLKQYIPSNLQALPYTNNYAVPVYSDYGSRVRAYLNKIPTSGNEKCWVGITAPTQLKPKKFVYPPIYDNFNDANRDGKVEYRKPFAEDINSYQFDDRLKLRIVGRFKKGKKDRLLVLKDGTINNPKWTDKIKITDQVGWEGDTGRITLGWMNIEDVDILEGVKCPGRVYSDGNGPTTTEPVKSPTTPSSPSTQYTDKEGWKWQHKPQAGGHPRGRKIKFKLNDYVLRL